MKHFAPLLLVFALLAACSQAPTGTSNRLVTVSLTVAESATGAMAALAPAAVPGGVTSAEVEIYLVNGADRSLDQTVTLDLTSPATDVQLLAGETYSFELSLQEDATEVAFERIEEVVTPELVVRFEPRSIIASLQVSQAYYDGSYLIVPIQALTPAGSVAPHTDYALGITAANGSITSQSSLGVEVVPDDAGTAVTLTVEVTGLLASRAEGTLQEEFSIVPSSVTPGEASIAADLTPPTASFTSVPDTLRVGYYTFVRGAGSDDRGLRTITLYENMKRVVGPISALGTSDDLQYTFEPESARTYTFHLVVTDEFGNVAVATHRTVVE